MSEDKTFPLSFGEGVRGEVKQFINIFTHLI